MSRGGQFDEGALRFDFDRTWQVVKYDNEPAYRDGIETLGQTKAVDFVGQHDAPKTAHHDAAKRLFFIEVKDFRRHRIENKERVSSGELANEVAHKVRDTIAGMIGAQRRRPDESIWGELVRALEHGHEIRVILWLEEDQPRGGKDIRADGRRSTLLKSLKARLRWLDARALVESRATGLPGVTVTGLARNQAP